ncbi:MAG: Rpn family recombination-promoting nuclease/putative transposase [Bacilli bacterium]|nr:Rpn family recombination-promoting nuclease/putative transposase [Bacilli bacterium]
MLCYSVFGWKIQKKGGEKITTTAVKEIISDSDYKWYTARSDKAFKTIMLDEKNKNLLKSLLEFILKTKINDMIILSNDVSHKNVNIKDFRTDIKLDTDIGKIDLEVNSFNKPYVHPKSMAYICEMYSGGTLSGGLFNQKTLYLQINFSYGLMLNDKNEILRKPTTIRPIRRYKVIELEDNQDFYVDNFVIYDINMDYFLNLWYSQDKKAIENKLLVMLGLNKEELTKFSKVDKEVHKFMEIMTNINKDPAFRIYMTEEEEREIIHNTELEEAKEQGIEQGIEQEKVEIAKKLLKMNMSIQDITQVTNLGIEEIKKIQEAL